MTWLWVAGIHVDKINPGPLKFHQGFVWKNPQIWPSNLLILGSEIPKSDNSHTIEAYHLKDILLADAGTEIDFEPNVASTGA